MMNSNELRVGNIIYIPETDQETFISAIIDFIGVKVNKNIVFKAIEFDKIKPIKLTEKWLEKFGFREIGEKLYCKRYRKKRVDIYKMINGDYPFYFRYNQEDLRIQYVHQLQNLYFALNGEELTKK